MSAYDNIAKEVTEARLRYLWQRDLEGAPKTAAGQLRNVWQEVRKKLGPSDKALPIECLKQVTGNGRVASSEYVFAEVTGAEYVFGIDIVMTVGDVTAQVTFDFFGERAPGKDPVWYVRVDREKLSQTPLNTGVEPSSVDLPGVAERIIGKLRTNLIAEASS